MGVALHAVGVASRAESLVHVVTVQDGFCYFSLESVVIPSKAHQPLSFKISQEVIWEEKKGVFSQVGLQNGLSVLTLLNQTMLFFVILI